jgi:ParB/RepB/Spo0J family partition protein
VGRAELTLVPDVTGHVQLGDALGPRMIESTTTIERLFASPDNPRGEFTDDSIASLVESVKAVGVLQPLIVRNKGKDSYWIVAGHRRARAAKLAGLRALRVLILPKDVRDPEAVAVIENEQRLALDPLKSAAAVEALLAREGATVEGVAALLGFPPRWVTLRAKLAKLSPAVRKAVAPGGFLSLWPVEWLCELAALAPASQDTLMRRHWQLERVGSIRELRDLTRDETRPLNEVPFDLDDAGLVQKAGACSACPKNSARVPYLFDGVDGVDTAKGRCLDAACYALKMNAWRGRVAMEKRAELGDKLLVTTSLRANHHEAMTGGEEKALVKAIAQPLTSPYELRPVKQGTPRAVPVLQVSGSEAGKVRWAVRGRDGAKARGAGKAKPSKPRSVEELRAALEAKREKRAVAAVIEKLGFADVHVVRDDDHLLELVAAFGCEPVAPRATKGKSLAWHALHLGAIPRRAEVFERVRAAILHRHFHGSMMRGGEGALVARDLCDCLGWNWGTITQKQREELPEPKAWAAGPQVEARKRKSTRAKRRKAG